MNKTSVKFRVRAKPPFNFDLSARIFSDEVGLCMRDEQICKYSNGNYRRVLRINDRLVLITVKSLGNVNKPKLEIELTSNEEIAENDKEITNRLVCSIFSLDFDLKPFYKAMEHYETMSKIIDELYGLKMTVSPTVFEALVYVILEQQISLQAAYNIEKRFIKKFGDELKIDNRVYYAFPSPEKLASPEIDDFRSCGISGRKAEYIHDIAESIIEKRLDLEMLKYEEDEEVMKKLCNIRGIGPWTAELTMIRGMNKLTVIPADDLGLREHIAHYYSKSEKRASSKEVRELADKWGEWKGLAGFYLTMVSRLKIEI